MGISEYFERIEQAHLDILESRKPIDQTIILWWGLDGLRLNEDGSLEWISRKKPEPVNQNVFWQPCQTANVRASFDMCQSSQAAMDELKMQLTQQAQNAAMIAALQINSALYPPYLYGGMGGTGSILYSPFTNCCCNQQWR